MADYYAICSRKASDLRNEIVEDIRIVLDEKGYNSTHDHLRVPNGYTSYYTVDVEPDRVIVDNHHTDHLDITVLLDVLRGCYHVMPK